MIAHLHKSFVWLWMAALLSATFGMSVEQVYCYCSGKTTVSIFNIEDGCLATQTRHVASSANCCSKKEAPVDRVCFENTASQKRDCTKKTTRVFQLRTEFEVGNFDFKKLEVLKVQEFNHNFPAFAQVWPTIQTVDLKQFEWFLPSLSGRMICMRHGVFLC